MKKSHRKRRPEELVKKPRGPITDEQRALVEENWRVVQWAVGKMVDAGAVYPTERQAALDAASVEAMNATRYWRPGRAKFTTYLTCAIWKGVPSVVRKQRTRKLVRMGREPRIARRMLSVTPDLRPQPQDDVDHEDACQRIMGLIDQLERMDPVNGKVMRLRAEGVEVTEIAAALGITRGRVNQRLARGKAWLGLRLGLGIPKTCNHWDRAFAWWGKTDPNCDALKKRFRAKRERKVPA